MRSSLNENEKVLLTVHQHWMVLLRPAVSVLVWAAVSGIWFHLCSRPVGSSVINNMTGISPSPTWYHILRWAGIVVALLLMLRFIWLVLVRKYNLWVITDQRIIDEFGVLTTNSKESPLNKINNVSYHQSLWGRIFGYGDVSIQTAAEMGATVYNNLAHPKLVKDTISAARGKFTKSFFREEGEAFADAVNEKEKASTQPDFAKEMEALYKLKTQGILNEDEYNAKKKKLMEGKGENQT